MRCLSLFAVILTTSSVILFAAGCGSNSSAQSDSAQSSSANVDEPVEMAGLPPGLADIDEHGEQGPHGGYIIELGRKHEYHAELVDNHETGTVSVYVLDHDMSELTVEPQVLTLHLTVAGEVTSYRLVAVVTSAGTASRFEATDRGLCHVLDDLESVSGKLRVTIGGKPFVGQIEHSHDSGCDHGHPH
jgi:hypothetical protein